jgi:hypothetical protein
MKLGVFVFNEYETIELPVRSAVLRQYTSRLVRWVAAGEYRLLYVFEFRSACEKSRQITL